MHLTLSLTDLFRSICTHLWSTTMYVNSKDRLNGRLEVRNPVSLTTKHYKRSNQRRIPTCQSCLGYKVKKKRWISRVDIENCFSTFTQGVVCICGFGWCVLIAISLFLFSFFSFSSEPSPDTLLRFPPPLGQHVHTCK